MARSDRLPGDQKHLQRLIQKKAQKDSLPNIRVQRLLNAMVVMAFLDRVRDEDNEPVFLLKGGVAMEMRLGMRSRATKDFDAAFRARTDEALDLLDAALVEPWCEFRVTRDAPEQAGAGSALSVRLRLTYRHKSWGTVKLEMAPAEGGSGEESDLVSAADFDDLQIPVPRKVRCLSLRYQVAQKLHACTEVFESGPENGRFRDVMDLLLLRDFATDVGLSRVREACIEVFELRGKQSWPPSLTVYGSWRDPFRAIASENGFDPTDLAEAAKQLDDFIREIDNC